MAKARHGHRRIRSVRPWWPPVASSAAAGAAIAALFNPIPALADPSGAQAPLPGAVPDTGSRPTTLGTLLMPGQTGTTTSTPSSTLTGVAKSPVLQKIDKGRDEISTLGDELIQLGQDRNDAKTQETTAEQQYTLAENALRDAQSEAATAAAADFREAAAMPPGAFGSGLLGLDDLAHLQRGQAGSSEAAARQLDLAQTAAQLALDAQTLAESHYTDALAHYTKLKADIATKQTAQDKYENAHRAELNAAETSQTATDSQLGAEYLAGASAGRGADTRAVQALEFALAQRGKPYLWSTEGPDTYDCSGLMWAAYRTVGFQLMRVSRDQYWQTRNKVVDRYSLLPGDLLFFSYSNSWRGIHHVAMYAGNGMMVEAPQTGLNVRLVPVRWSSLFQATRVFGSVPGGSAGPTLGTPDPVPAATAPTTSPTTNPTTTSPTTKPTTSSPTTKPTTSSPTTSPTTAPTSSSPTTSPTTSSPATSAPTTLAPTTTSPSVSTTTNSPAASDSSTSATVSTSSSATAAEETLTSG